MEKNISRRSFLKGAAIGAAGLTVASAGLNLRDAKADDDLALAVRVACVHDAFHVRPFAKRLDRIELFYDARVRFAVVARTQLETEFWRKAGKPLHLPALPFLRAGIILDIV